MRTARSAGRLVAVLVSALLLGGSVQPAARADQGSGTLLVRTVPATAGARVAAEGQVAYTDKHGIARLAVRNFAELDSRFHVLDTRVSKDRKVAVDRIVGAPSQRRRSGQPLVVGLRTERLVHWAFVDRGGREVPTDQISLLELRSNTGEVLRLTGRQLSRPLWVSSGRTQQTSRGLMDKSLYWSVSRVVVDGADVVNRGQQVFTPDRQRHWQIQLLFYRVQFGGRDLLFGSASGTGVAVTRPDGVEVRYPFKNGGATVPSMARGTYQIRVYGSGLSFARPVSISKDQKLDVEVISRADLYLVATIVLMFALSLVLVGRRHHVVRAHRVLVARLARVTGTSSRVGVVVTLCTLVLLVVAVPLARGDVRTGADTVGPGGQPVFAYYYIWYNPTSWLRAKKDYPLLGRYSSDDPTVMRTHVAMAKAAGLTGFIVSWKGRGDLDARLATLVRISEQQHFKLAVVYEGLDFHRRPLPVAKVSDDLVKLADQYATSPVFDAFGKPVVVLTGSEQYTPRQLREIVQPVRNRLQVLSSAKSVEDYRRTAAILGGDAYYWSSADPRHHFYAEKMREMGAAVHRSGGLWLAPAASGFDARLIGGSQVIPRRNGDTLRQAMQVARSSHPDGIAVISWNEFSENSNIEPSERVGMSALRTLAAELGGTVRVPKGLTGSHASESHSGLTGWGALLALLFGAAVLNVVLALRKNRASDPEHPFRELPRGRPGDEPDPDEPTDHKLERTWP
ncbi:MAG: hypothetical protein ACXVEL_16285 [Nocardioidaceae bacterium]